MYLIGYLQTNQLVMACSGIELGIVEAAVSIAFPPYALLQRAPRYFDVRPRTDRLWHVAINEGGGLPAMRRVGGARSQDR